MTWRALAYLTRLSSELALWEGREKERGGLEMNVACG